MTPSAALKRALNRPLVSGTTALVVSATLAGGVAVAVDRPSSARAASTTSTASSQAAEAARAQAAAAVKAEAARKQAVAKAEAARKAAAKAKAEAKRKAAAKAAAKRKAAAKAAAKRKAAARAAAARKAQRAAERRAAERRAEKRRAAKRKAAARAQRVSRSTERRSVSGGSPKAIARGMVASRWGAGQFSCLERLWSKESGWRVTANNPSSSAYGIPQALPGSKMASAGPNWRTNARTQITWGLNYISASYGSPCAAWAHSRSHNWY
jgi:hypothetical protein